MRARLRRIWPWLLAIPGVATAVSLAVEPLAAVQRMETVFYDLQLTTFSHPPARSTDIAIVAIDDATVHGIRENETYARNFGNWPYTRNLWTRVLAQLKAEGARAVVMDFAMDERSSDPGQDATLREEIASERIPLYAGLAVNIPTERGLQLPRVTAEKTGALPGACSTALRARPRMHRLAACAHGSVRWPSYSVWQPSVPLWHNPSPCGTPSGRSMGSRR